MRRRNDRPPFDLSIERQAPVQQRRFNARPIVPCGHRFPAVSPRMSRIQRFRRAAGSPDPSDTGGAPPHRFNASRSRPTAICPWHSPRVRDQRLAISSSARRQRVRRPRRGPTQRPVRPPRHPRTIRRPRGQSRAIYRPTLRPARQLSENRLDHQLSPLRGTQLQALCRRSRSAHAERRADRRTADRASGAADRASTRGRAWSSAPGTSSANSDTTSD
jgi:hypothetical protein